MKKDITQYVSTYLTCQKVKAKHKKLTRLLQPLPISEWKWEGVTIDFVIGLPTSKTNKYAFWVVADQLTKTTHFIPINVRDSMEKLAQTYSREIVRLHEVPSSIVSDQDPRFTSKF
jgi:hypothetical protein